MHIYIYIHILRHAKAVVVIALLKVACEDSILQNPTKPSHSASPFSILDLWVRRSDDAMRLGSVFGPESLRKFWCVILQTRRRPLRERGQGDALRLCGAVGTCSRFCQVLLVVVFSKVKELAPIFLIIRSRGALGGDFATKSLFIRILGREDKGLLLVIKPVESRSILCAAIVTLPHTLRRVVTLPKPAQDIGVSDFFGVEHNLHCLSVAALTTAGFLICGIGSKPSAIPTCRSEYAR
mmetsp:Transcript_46222/g.67848  ORF Transcript_46222/g.67848 Transcript_46222/m.67848 type:complete len:238 (-) Transcript_46222:196-909(-)